MQNYLQLLLCPAVLHYCNSLLYGISNIDLTRLQHVQNRLTRVLTRSPPITCSVPLLHSLHCLSIKFRILFRISLLIYKTLHEKQPVYLHSMLAASLPSQSLRSNNDNSLSVPRVKTNTGSRAYHSRGPSLLYNLPMSLCSAIPFQEASEDISLTRPFPLRH